MLIFIGGHVLARSLRLLQQHGARLGGGFRFEALHGDQVAGFILFGLVGLVLPAAGIGAGALVGVAVIHVARQQAAAGIGNAQRAVNEDFQFHLRDPLADFFNLVQRQLAGQNDPAYAVLIPELYRRPVDRVGLHRKMNWQIGPALAHQHHQAGIGHNQGVGAEFDNGLQVANVAAHLVIVRRHIRGQIKLFAQCMGLVDARGQGFQVFELVVAHPQAVAGLACVDRVGAIGKGVTHIAQAASGGKQFAWHGG